MPLFRHASPPDVDAALRWVRTRFPDSPLIGPLMGEDNTYTAAIPGGQFGLTHVPAALPKGDLEWLVDRAWHWNSAAATVERHIAHEICFAASSDLDAIELGLLHSRIIAGLAATGGASAVYVGSASLVRDDVAYIDDLDNSSHDNLPLLSWVGFNPVNVDGWCAAFTTGLGDFGLLEVEMQSRRREWPDLFEFLANLAHYQLASGIQVGDGETVGRSDGERIVVRHVKSRFTSNERVAQVNE